MLNNADYFDFLSKDAYFDGSYKVVRKADRVLNKQNATLNAEVLQPHLRPLFAADVLVNNAI